MASFMIVNPARRRSWAYAGRRAEREAVLPPWAPHLPDVDVGERALEVAEDDVAAQLAAHGRRDSRRATAAAGASMPSIVSPTAAIVIGAAVGRGRRRRSSCASSASGRLPTRCARRPGADGDRAARSGRAPWAP